MNFQTALPTHHVHTNTGTINISSGAVFSNTGYYIHDGGTMTGTGTFNQAGGFVTLDAALTVPASLTFNYTGGSTNGAGTLTATNLNFSGGNISGTGGLTLNGTTTWTGGGFLRNFAIAAGDIINAKQGSKSIGGTMTINGTMNITGNGITDAGTLINNGIINKTVVESAQADMIVNWSNAGTINILAGELSNSTPYPSRSFTNTGTINISSGAVFSNTGYYIHGGGAMTGTGTFNQAGGFLTLDAALTVPASLTFNYTGGNTNGAGTLTATNLNFSGGNIGGTGDLTLNGTTTWTGGGFFRNFAIAAGNIINADQGSKSIGGTMTINGTMNITGNGINNGGGMLINNGTINKSVVSTTVASLGMPVVNNASGIIKGTGELGFDGTFTNDGTIAPGNSPGLLVVNGAQPFSANSTLAIELLNNSGPGTGHDLMERSGSLTLNGIITVTELAAMPLTGYTIINLTSGTISGNFATINLPSGYTMTVGSTTVILNKISFALPLSFISFEATKQTRSIQLEWITDNEINTSHFEIERSSDGLTYTRIGSIPSNNITGVHHYQFTDQSPLQKTNYYRLKQVDIDARHIYSRTAKIDFSKLITVSVSPNPARNRMLIEGAENYAEIQLINMQGTVLKQMKGAVNLRVDVSNLPAGQYFLRLTGKYGEEAISFLKQ